MSRYAIVYRAIRPDAALGNVVITGIVQRQQRLNDQGRAVRRQARSRWEQPGSPFFSRTSAFCMGMLAGAAIFATVYELGFRGLGI